MDMKTMTMEEMQGVNGGILDVINYILDTTVAYATYQEFNGIAIVTTYNIYGEALDEWHWNL